jgi:hypothetical protein
VIARRTAGSPRRSVHGALGHQDLRLAGRGVPRRRIGAAIAFEVVLVAIDEHHHVGVLLDRAGIAEVRQLRPLVGPLLDGAAELAQRQHRARRALGERLQAARDLGEGLTAFCCHRGRARPNAWCTTDAPRPPAPSMPVRKYYSVRRRHFPLDAPAQCCGVCVPTFTNRGSASWPSPRPSLDTPGRRPVFRPPRFSRQGWPIGIGKTLAEIAGIAETPATGPSGTARVGSCRRHSGAIGSGQGVFHAHPKAKHRSGLPTPALQDKEAGHMHLTCWQSVGHPA